MNAVITLPTDHEHFAVYQHDEQDWIIVKPQGIKQKWKPQEKWWRSTVTDLTGRVLSMGLMKFKNFSEDQGDKALLIAALKSGEPVIATEKLDGSLVIRSVINGQVILRTRGMFGTENNAMHLDVRIEGAKYPVLMDPTYRPDESLHFEFRHPDHKVILSVDEPSITLLSGVRHADLSLFTYAELETIAAEIGVELVEIHELPNDLDELLHHVARYEDKEGVVIRVNGEQTYIKVKGEQYLTQHRMKFAFSPFNAVQLCRRMKFASPEQFMDHMFSLKMDWELASDRVKWWQVYEDIRESVDRDIADVAEFLRVYGDLYESDRKEYARLVTDGYADQELRTPCFTIAGGKATLESSREALMDQRIQKRASKK